MRSRLAVVAMLAFATVAVNIDSGTTDAAPGGAWEIGASNATLGALGGAAGQALAHLVDTASARGLSGTDVADMIVTDVVLTGHTGTTNVYIQQRYQGIDVFGAVINVAIGADGSVVAAVGEFVPGLQKLAPSAIPRTSMYEASVAASSALGLIPTSLFSPIGAVVGDQKASLMTDGGISRSDIPVRLVYQQIADGTLRLAWELIVEEFSGTDWWQIRVDADSGVELDRNNLIATDSYNVYDIPTEAPSFGTRTISVDPADPVASPFGWHDTDGVAGAESTLTEGNNVIAYTDTNADNLIDPGSQPTGGASLVFSSPVDPAAAPATYADALVTNLFYWNNVMHDTFYAYGFDEAAGNFQLNNYGNGGVGGDPVLAETLDGIDLGVPNSNNANFATPADGFAPRMQMFRWTISDPDRGSSFDNGIIAHEYGHGISNRLTGGPNNVVCLDANESPGEGWSDFFALVMTMEPGDAGTGPRSIGTYVLGQPPSGSGIRTHPYTTDLVIDPRTYDTIKTSAVPHGVGSVFTTMLWEMTWALIDRDGFDADLINGTGGNNTAIQLVIDGLKLQPCNPGFVDARDAILLADQLANAGSNECVIRKAFAKRGVGLSATQGTSASKLDGVEAFDLPAHCRDLQLTKTVSHSTIAAGAQLTYRLEIRNNSAAPLTGVTVTDPVPTGTTYALNSADCGGSETAGTVTFAIGVLAPATSIVCSFIVTVDGAPTTVSLFADGFESGTAKWTISPGAFADEWAESLLNPKSPVTSMFAVNVPTTSDQYLTTVATIPISTLSVLRFWHDYDLENTWDGGVVEVSIDGVAWDDAGPLFTQNGYVGTLMVTGNPLASRSAFTGSSGGYIESVVDLSSYAGSSVFLRFRLGTDSIIGAVGWHVDDVTVIDEVWVDNVAVATSNETPSEQSQVTTAVTGHGLLRVTTVPPLASQITLDGTALDRWGIDWMKLTPGTYEVCFTHVDGWQTPPCSSVDVTAGLTTTVDGTFNQNGFVRVMTSPPVPATISVDGIASDDWEVWVDMTPGPHTICFGNVPDFTTPACEAITVVAGGALQIITGNYLDSPGAPGPSGHGLLRVTTTPGVASVISVDGIIRDTWGLNWVKVPPGSYEVCFSDVVDFFTPACETAVVVAGETATLDGAFTARGILRVITALPHPSTIFVDGVPRDDWGIWTDISVGDHLVCFGEDAGFAPPCQTVSLVAGPNPPVTGVWPP